MPFNAMFTTNFPGNGEHTSTICGDDWEMVSYIDTHIKLIGLSFCTLFLAEILFGLVSSRIWVMNQWIFFWVSKKLIFPPLKWRWTSHGDQPFMSSSFCTSLESDHWNDLGNKIFPSLFIFFTPHRNLGLSRGLHIKPWLSRIFGTLENGA